MNWLTVIAIALLYILVGMILMRWTIRRGALTVQDNSYYGVAALIWPLMAGLVVYSLFNAIVHAIVEVR